jgi:hypothetical protein
MEPEIKKPRKTSNIYKEAEEYRNLSPILRKVIAFPIDLEIFLKQCRCHDRFVCPSETKAGR